VLGDYPVRYGNGIGETLGNLLATFPEDRLFQAYPSHLPPSAGTVRGHSVPFDMPRRPAWVPGWANAAYYPLLKLRQSLAEQALVSRAAAAIEQHQIEAVLTYPVTPWVLFAAVRLRRRFPRVRFVFYVMDDWEGHHTCFGLPFTAARRRALHDIVVGANARFACSHLMRHDYEQRFGNAWQVLHKGVPPRPAATPMRPLGNAWRILYAGGMNVFRADAVLAFVEGLRLFRQRTAMDATLTLLGAANDKHALPELQPYDFVHVEPWVDNAACQQRLEDADLLYLPLSLLPRLDRIANLAMPTKISEYLAANRPVIFHVPATSEVQRLAAEAALPLTINSGSPQDVCDLLTRLHRDGLDLATYQARAQALLASEFDERVLQARLLDGCFAR
jgi:hypothetical protein